MTQWITSDSIHDGIKFLPKGTCIEVNENEEIVAIANEKEIINSTIKRYKGIIIPKFINAHCHLELSHLKGVIKQRDGIVEFVKGIISQRNKFSKEIIEQAIVEALKESKENGIIAIGDICNTSDTAIFKENEKEIYFHNFIEALGILPSKSELNFNNAKQLLKNFSINKKSKASIVPHAPYSVANDLMKEIMNTNGVKTIHIEESKAEQIWLKENRGDFEEFFEWLGIEKKFIEKRGLSSWEWLQSFLGQSDNIILVHGTFFDIHTIKSILQRKENVSICLCPNANIYIENQLPNIEILHSSGINICIGTDSLASNCRLCILSELNTIKSNFPYIEWEELIKWGTYNGAKALNIEDEYGRICIGRKKQIGLLKTSKTGIMQYENIND